MSIHILEKPHRRHTILDDIESVYWILLYCAVHWLRHSTQGFGFEIDMFDEETVRRLAGQPPLSTGGTKKSAFLTKDFFKELQFDSKPLNDLLQQFGQQFKTIYLCEPSDEEDIRARGRAASERLADVTVVLEIFNAALRRTDWPEDGDRVPDQFPPKTENETTRQDHKNTASAYGTGSGESSALRPTNVAAQESISSTGPSSISTGSNRSAGSMSGPPRGGSRRRGATAQQTDRMRKRAIISASTTSRSASGSSVMLGDIAPSNAPSTPELGPVAGSSVAPSSESDPSSGQENSPKRKRGSLSEDMYRYLDTPTKKTKK